MKIEKICEYLNEIGILEYENINTFLEIYSKLNNKNYTRLIDKLRDTLIIYFNNNFIKNNRLAKLCESIIISYSNYQLILKYRTLNNLKNILTNKIQNRYLSFFLNISLYIQKKNNANFKKRNLSTKKIKNKKILSNEKNKINNEENSELISSDDERECTFTPQINKNFKGYKKPEYNNIESHVYYSPAFNITSKFPMNNYQNYIQTRNNNNYINNMQRDNMNMNALNYNNNTDNSYYSNYSNNNNYNNLNVSQDSRSNRSYNPYDNNIQMQNKKINNDYISKGLNNNKFSNNDSYYNNNYYDNNKILNKNNFYDNEILINYNNQNINRNIYNNNLLSQNIQENFNRSDEFFNKEMYHVQKVKDKIQNMKLEKLNKIKEECTFEPKINTNYKRFYPQKKENENYIHMQTQPQPQPQTKPPISYKTIPINNNINNINNKKLRPKETLETIKENENLEQNSIASKKKKENKKRSYSEKKKGIKIMEDLSLAKKRRTEKTKKLLKERNYTPKIKKSDKYKDHIKMTFEERRLKSIALKNKYKNAKKEENPINNVEILAPGEMCRFKENNNYNNLNYDNKNVENSEIGQNENIRINNNFEDEKEKINNLDNNIENNEHFDENFGVKEIEKNKLLLMDRIKGEHKIGFKVKKEDEENEKKENIEINKDINEVRNNDVNKNNDDKIEMEHLNTEEKEENFEEKLENKKQEFSFSPSGFHSNALKEILDKKAQI